MSSLPRQFIRRTVVVGTGFGVLVPMLGVMLVLLFSHSTVAAEDTPFVVLASVGGALGGALGARISLLLNLAGPAIRPLLRMLRSLIYFVVMIVVVASVITFPHGLVWSALRGDEWVKSLLAMGTWPEQIKANLSLLNAMALDLAVAAMAFYVGQGWVSIECEEVVTAP